jgi:hypothetical protein
MDNSYRCQLRANLLRPLIVSINSILEKSVDGVGSGPGCS